MFQSVVRSTSLIVTLIGCLAFPALAQGGTADGERPSLESMAASALSEGEAAFIQNAGQWPAAEIRYALDSHGVNVGLTDQGPRFQVFRPEEETGEIGTAPNERLSERDGMASVSSKATAMHEFGIVFDGAARVIPRGRK